MVRRRLGQTQLHVTPIGFGAFKIGRNQGIKYPNAYDLPDHDQAHKLLHALLDMGINYIDTAPAYGLSEQRIGQALSHRRDEFVLSTKVGETFQQGQSQYDFSGEGVRHSVMRSLKRLHTSYLDIVFIHSDGRDQYILDHTDAVPTLLKLRDEGLTRAIGLSGKTPEGALAALEWADVIMVPYHRDDITHDQVIQQAAAKNLGVVVKKGLASGHLPPAQAIEFVLAHPGVDSLVIGGLNIEHMHENFRVAQQARSDS